MAATCQALLQVLGIMIKSKKKIKCLSLWKDWCWNSNTLVTWYEELTHWKRPWCWEWLKAGGEADDRGWFGWMASPTWWTWVWGSSRSWWWMGKPGILQSMGWQRVRHDWVTELTWNVYYSETLFFVYHGEGNGYPLQNSCPENPMDRGAWWATAVHGVAKSWTRLSD